MSELDLPQNRTHHPSFLARIRRRLPRQAFTHWQLVLMYLAALTLAEAVTNLLEARVGLVLHGILLVVLFLHASLSEHARLRGFLLSLALAPLIRLLSLSLPLPNFPFMYWYMVVGTPLLIAAFFAGRIGDINAKMQGLTLRAIPWQILISLTGIGLGYLEYQILRPQPLISELTLEQFWIPALILLIFTGFLEEWIFRGLMQYTALRNFGRGGFVYVAAVFAVLHLGYKSLLDVFFVFAVALFFGWAVLKTGSILGATMAHGLTNIGLFLVFPFLVGPLVVVTPGVATPTPVVQQPGLLAPVAPTEQATRPFVPPTRTPSPPTLTPTWTVTWTVTPSPSATPEWTLTPTEQPSATITVCGQPGGWVPYTVRAGDTLSSLAQRFGTTVAELVRANCLASTAIQAGQSIYVPNVPGVLSTPTRTPIPTNTSEPTDIPEPSLIPTEISQPSVTPTDIPTPSDPPTNTPAPSETPTESPTETLTPTPSDTPVPNDTPISSE